MAKITFITHDGQEHVVDASNDTSVMNAAIAFMSSFVPWTMIDLPSIAISPSSIPAA